MTFERAAELIEKLPDVVDRADLFDHFVKYFEIAPSDRLGIIRFAALSGFVIAKRS